MTESIPESKRYNGWTNYETWNVALWIGNEEGSYRYWQDAAREVWAEAEQQMTHDGARVLFSREEVATGKLAERLKSEFDEQAPDLGASCWSDLLSAALSEVNWHEIAGHLINDAKDADDSKDAEDAEE